MKYIVKAFVCCFLLNSFLLSSCDDDKETMEIPKKQKIEIENLTDNTISLIEYDTYAVSAKLVSEEPVDDEEYSFIYTSSNESVFEVSESGVITAVGVGEAALQVRVSTNTDIWTLCLVNVEEKLYPVTSITIPEEYKEFYMAIDKKFDLGSVITINPENASDPTIIYASSDEMIATVDEKGRITTYALGDVNITMKTVDGSNVSVTSTIHVRNVVYTPMERTGWSVTTAYEYMPDTNVKGTPESLIDDDIATCLVMIKPGKTFEGITIPSTEVCYFILDMQSQKKFNYFQIRHRNSTSQNMLRVKKVSLYGSNDGENFTEIQKDITVPGTDNNNTILPDPFDIPESEYRYIKMVYEEWSTGSGSTMQIAEVYVGTIEYEEE